MTPALILKLAPPAGGGRRGCERDYGMAKLHEMSLGAGRAMHKQTMSHRKKKKEKKHINSRNKQDFHAINKQIHKQTNKHAENKTKEKRGGGRGVTAISVAANEGYSCAL